MCRSAMSLLVRIQLASVFIISVMDDFNNVLLLPSICCMACDGEIANEEVDNLKRMSHEEVLFGEEDISLLLPVIMDSLSKYGYEFVKSYLDLLEKAEFSEQQEIQILDVATRTIYADEKVEYDEVKFFKSIRKRLKVSDDQILEQVEGVEEYWLSDDAQDNNISAFEHNFRNVDYTSIKIE